MKIMIIKIIKKLDLNSEFYLNGLDYLLACLLLKLIIFFNNYNDYSVWDNLEILIKFSTPPITLAAVSNPDFFNKIGDLAQRYSKSTELRKFNGNRGSKHFIYINRTFFGLYNLMFDLKASDVKINQFKNY